MTSKMHEYLASIGQRYAVIRVCEVQPGDQMIRLKDNGSVFTGHSIKKIDEVQHGPRLTTFRSKRQKFEISREFECAILKDEINLIRRPFHDYTIVGQRPLSPLAEHAHLVVVMGNKWQSEDLSQIWATAIYDDQEMRFRDAGFRLSYPEALADFTSRVLS